MSYNRDFSKEVKRIISEQLDVELERIVPEARLIEDLEADSLGLVELTLALEEAFEMEIPDEDAEKIRTVVQTINYVESHARR